MAGDEPLGAARALVDESLSELHHLLAHLDNGDEAAAGASVADLIDRLQNLRRVLDGLTLTGGL